MIALLLGLSAVLPAAVVPPAPAPHSATPSASGLGPAPGTAVAPPLGFSATSSASSTSELPGYRFQPGEPPRVYTYTLAATTTQTIAGETLTHSTELVWRCALRVPSATAPTFASLPAGTVPLHTTIFALTARHRGPGIDVRIDTTTGAGSDDRTLGHLHALAEATVVLAVEPLTGAVASASGGDAIVAAINRLRPSEIPGEEPPLDRAARESFSDAALARLWDRLLRLPPGGEALRALPFVLPGAAHSATPASLAQQWKDATWTLALPADQPRLPITLFADPTPVRGAITAVRGNGTTQRDRGWPGRSDGTATLDLSLDALTQHVAQRLELRWSFQPTPIR